MISIAELECHNVVKFAIAFTIVAWLLIEVAATTFPILQLLERSVTLVTVLLIIGLPVALFVVRDIGAGYRPEEYPGEAQDAVASLREA